MAYPYTLDDTLRSYDELVYHWLDGLKVDYGELGGDPKRNFGILRVYATPNRAYASMEDLLVRKGWLNPDTPGDGSGGAVPDAGRRSYMKIPLPFASITRSAPVFDTTRSLTKMQLSYYSEDFDHALKFKTPSPYNIPYQIEFWCKTKFTEIHILEWITSQIDGFGLGHTEFFLKYSPKFGMPPNEIQPFGTKLITVVIDDMSDNSDLEPGEGDRQLRFSVQLTLKAWFFLPPKTSDNRYGKLNGPADIVRQQIVPPISQPEQVPLVFSVQTDVDNFNIVNNNLDSFDIYSFNLIKPDNFSLSNNSNNSKFIIYGDSFKFYSSSDEDFISTNPVLVLPEEDYSVNGFYKSHGIFTIQILDLDSTIVHTQTFPEALSKTRFNINYTNTLSNTQLSIRIFASKRLLIYNPSMKRMTKNYTGV